MASFVADSEVLVVADDIQLERDQGGCLVVSDGMLTDWIGIFPDGEWYVIGGAYISFPKAIIDYLNNLHNKGSA